MTEYRVVHVRARSFRIQTSIPEQSSTTHVRLNADDTRITRAGDTRITRAGDTRVARSYTNANLRTIRVKKRNFRTSGQVSHG